MSEALRSLFAEFTIRVDNSPLRAADAQIDATKAKLSALGAQMGAGIGGLPNRDTLGRFVAGAGQGRLPDFGPGGGGLAPVNLDEWNKAATAAEPKTASLFERIGGLHAALAAFATSHAVRELGEMVSAGLESAHAIELQSTALGINVEEMQRWRAFAKTNQFEVANLKLSFRTLSQQMLEASQDGGSKAAATFKALGVNVTDTHGRLKPLSESLIDVGGALAEMPDVTKRTALGATLLGRSALTIIPAFKGGAGEVRKFMASLDEMGVIIDHEAIEKSTRAARQFEIFKLRLEVLKQKIALEVAPWLLRLAEALGPVGVTALAVTAAVGPLAVLLAEPLTKGFKLLRGAIRDWAAEAGGGKWQAFKSGIMGIVLPLLILQDVIYWLMGKDSLIGSLLNRFMGTGSAKAGALAFKEAWQSIPDAFRMIWAEITDAADADELTAKFLKDTEHVTDFFDSLFAKLRNGFEGAGASLVKFVQPALEKIGGWVQAAIDKLAKLFVYLGMDGPTVDKFGNVLKPGQPAYEMKLGTPIEAPRVPGAPYGPQPAVPFTDNSQLTVNVNTPGSTASAAEIAHTAAAAVQQRLTQNREHILEHFNPAFSVPGVGF